MPIPMYDEANDYEDPEYWNPDMYHEDYYPPLAHSRETDYSPPHSYYDPRDNVRYSPRRTYVNPSPRRETAMVRYSRPTRPKEEYIRDQRRRVQAGYPQRNHVEPFQDYSYYQPSDYRNPVPRKYVPNEPYYESDEEENDALDECHILAEENALRNEQASSLYRSSVSLPIQENPPCALPQPVTPEPVSTDVQQEQDLAVRHHSEPVPFKKSRWSLPVLFRRLMYTDEAKKSPVSIRTVISNGPTGQVLDSNEQQSIIEQLNQSVPTVPTTVPCPEPRLTQLTQLKAIWVFRSLPAGESMPVWTGFDYENQSMIANHSQNPQGVVEITDSHICQGQLPVLIRPSLSIGYCARPLWHINFWLASSKSVCLSTP
ncbi:hypothetical protein CLU79DRAFT_733211 [Phycomyces nitens]|nr:hypothetical protein CLU79DRAFT_733211 [Phycomyces nitens]